MGLPDEGLGLSKKRFRLGLSSKRKGNHKEPAVAENQNYSVISSSNDMNATIHHAMDGKNQVCTEINSPRQKDPLVPPVASLYNIGNTCYLNCILQVLRYTPGFIKNLSALKESIQEESRFKRKVPKGNTTQKTSVWKLVDCLDDLFRYLRSKENDYTDLCPTDSDTMSIRPDELLCQIRKFNPLFEENSQHDAQELLRCLLSCLDDAEAELETSQTQRKQQEEKSSSLQQDDSNSLNHGNGKRSEKVENLDSQSGISTSNTSKLRGRKRKSAINEQKCDNQFNSPIMMKFLNRKTTKSLSHNQIAREQENKDAHEQENKDVGNEWKYTENSGDNQNSKNVNDVLDDDHKVGTGSDLNLSSGPQDLGSFNVSTNENSSSQCTEGRKRLRLEKRGNKDQNKNDVILVSSDEENIDMKSSFKVENCNQTSQDSNEKSSLLHGTTEIIEDPISSLSVQTTNPRSENDGSKLCNSDPEESLVSADQNGNRYMISPGKHLTIHSPIRSGELSPKANLSSPSRSFLSKIHGFLPNTAKKILNFSPSESTDPTLSHQSVTLTTTSNSQDTNQNSAVLEGIGATNLREFDSDVQSTSQHVYEAKLKLKRCDWLGVSPVKSISANLVLEKIKNESVSKSPVCKRIKFESDENLETKYRKHDVGKLNIEESRCDPNKSESEKKQTIINFATGNPHSSRNSSQLKSKSVTNINRHERSTKYKGCQLKPLSIQLKKLDWLGTDCKDQSFNLRDILKKEKSAAGIHYPHGLHGRRHSTIHVNHLKYLFLSTDKPKTHEARQKLVQGLFGGVMGHRTSCCECEKASNRSESFLDVSIPVRILSSHDSNSSSDEDEERNDRNSESCVFKLLKSLSTRERLCNDNKYFCDQCFSLVEAEHFCFFQDLPKVLAIHLKRFDAGLGSLTGYVSKISDHVSVPEHLPCLIPDCNKSDCEHRYSLYAVVTHSGSSILRGHYRSYVKVTSSFNKQLYRYMNEDEDKNHHQRFLPPSPISPQSYLSIDNDSSVTASNTSPSASLVGYTVEDITKNSFMYSKQTLPASDTKYGTSEELASMASKCGQDVQMKEYEGGEDKSWWLECDDESIRVFEEEEFLDRLSEDKSAALLGTPYILFYHHSYITL